MTAVKVPNGDNSDPMILPPRVISGAAAVGQVRQRMESEGLKIGSWPCLMSLCDLGTQILSVKATWVAATREHALPCGGV